MQTGATAEEGAAQPAEEKASVTAQAEWPGFEASAEAVLTYLMRYGAASAGLDEKAIEEGLVAQVTARPKEFADALVMAIPGGYPANTAMRENDNSFAEMLRNTRGLPYIATLMPPETATEMLAALHRKIGMIEWHFAAEFDHLVDGRFRTGELEDKDVEENSVLWDILYGYGRVLSDVERAIAQTRVDVTPRMKRWPPAPMDVEKRNAVMRKYASDLFEEDIESEGVPGNAPRIVETVSLAEFFDGNTQHDSIAPNLWFKHPGIEFMRHTLEAILARPEVTDVRIGVHEWPFPEEDTWIAAENVYIWATDVELEQVTAWLKPLYIDGVGDATGFLAPIGGPAREPGLKLFSAGWD